ncbi:hypothetical protein C8Q77DRAFT_1095070 [Trametes polyzona]|nr:hypothetical protein C8Q77DRAFT_1095070 [Trametes polyzona]
MNATTDGSDSLRELVAEAAAAEQQYRALNYVNLAAFGVCVWPLADVHQDSPHMTPKFSFYSTI